MDSLKLVQQRSHGTSIEARFPILKEGFIRFCVHRRENCSSKSRFSAIFNAMKELVLEGRNVLLISLFATEQAIDTFGLRKALEQLCRRENFIYSPVWPYYRDVIAVMKRCSVCATDSGSMQEEMNILKVPCVTLRFGSDRAETFMAGGNVPAPPLSSKLISKIIRAAWDSEEMRATPNLYGENVSRRIVDKCMAILAGGEKLFRYEDDRLGSII